MIHLELVFFQAPFPKQNHGKQPWTLGLGVERPMAELLSCLGSQFEGKL